jgi:hypothetical protein
MLPVIRDNRFEIGSGQDQLSKLTGVAAQATHCALFHL